MRASAPLRAPGAFSRRKAQNSVPCSESSTACRRAGPSGCPGGGSCARQAACVTSAVVTATSLSRLFATASERDAARRDDAVDHTGWAGLADVEPVIGVEAGPQAIAVQDEE